MKINKETKTQSIQNKFYSKEYLTNYINISRAHLSDTKTDAFQNIILTTAILKMMIEKKIDISFVSLEKVYEDNTKYQDYKYFDVKATINKNHEDELEFGLSFIQSFDYKITFVEIQKLLIEMNKIELVEEKIKDNEKEIENIIDNSIFKHLLKK